MGNFTHPSPPHSNPHLSHSLLLLTPSYFPPPPPHTLTQTLEEPPGEDCTRFDTVIPTVVRPPRTPPQYTPPRGLKEGGEEGECDDELELGILRQFTFSSELQVLQSSHTVNCACPHEVLHVYS